MCKIFGVSAAERVRLNEALREFFSQSNENPHGWGLACAEGADVVAEKEPLQASKSNYLRERLSVPVEAKTAFAHIRYATIGNVEYANCHPFVARDARGRPWTLVHNGTIFDCAELNRFSREQIGDTDSERILLFLVDTVNREEERLGRAASAEERFLLFDAAVAAMAPGNKLNLLLYDGELCYAHTNYADSLHVREEDGRVFFSTSPLRFGDGNDEWRPLPFMTPLAYRDGRLAFTGTPHAFEYMDDAEKLKYLYGVFSGL